MPTPMLTPEQLAVQEKRKADAERWKRQQVLMSAESKTRLPTLDELENSPQFEKDVLTKVVAVLKQEAIDQTAAEMKRDRSVGIGDAFAKVRAEWAHSQRGSLNEDALSDGADVVAQGKEIAARGIDYVVDGLIPNYGMLGMLVAYAKVGKTTMGYALGAAVSNGEPFLGRITKKCRVLIIAAEDPPDYTAWVARKLDIHPGNVTFYRESIILNDAGLAAIAKKIKEGGYGLVIIASWQAVIRGLVESENDNAGAVNVVERVKLTTRETNIPWLIDAHSGKGEDQSDDADPIRALRGASGAAGSADFLLSLRYADGPYSPKRRLSGKGRFVMFDQMTIAYDEEQGTYQMLGETKSVAAEEMWQGIQKSGVLGKEKITAHAIAKAMGEIKPNGATVKWIKSALRSRPGVICEHQTRGAKDVEVFSLDSEIFKEP